MNYVEGRELDALIAEKVFGKSVQLRACWADPECGGWEEIQSGFENDDGTPSDIDEWNAEIMAAKSNKNTGIQYGMQPCCRSEPTRNNWEVVPNYSTDIAAAWQVVEKLRETWEYVFLNGGNGWRLSLATNHLTTNADNTFKASWDEHFDGENAPTAPMAICLAALKAVGG